jgi:hypothetical protein
MVIAAAAPGFLVLWKASTYPGNGLALRAGFGQIVALIAAIAMVIITT